MKNDFEMIIHKLGRDISHLNIYPIGDLHIGSPDFDENIWKKWSDVVRNDESSRIVIVGDMVDNGLKTSKTDSYCAKMRPREQKEWLLQALRPLQEKIIGATQGNHEGRSGVSDDACPLYDVLAKLDLEDLYRENMAFIKLNLGQRTLDRQVSYTIVLGHGAGRNKTENFSYAVDNMDLLVTGHTHQASSRFPSKIVIDSHNEVIRRVGFVHITVPSFQSYGGYAVKSMYLPQDSTKFPMITLDGKEKEIKVLWT